MRKKYSRRIAVFCIMLLAFSVCGCGEENGNAGMPGGMMGRQGGLSVAVETQEISNATIEEYSKISCEVQAANEVRISPKVSGTIEKVYVSIGDTVQAGDVLFEIDKSSLQRQVTQANSSYVQAQVNYDAVLNGSLKNELANQQANAREKQSSYENALRTYERDKALFDSGALAQSELESAELTMNTRKREMENAQRSLALYESSTMQGNLKTVEATLAQARANYESAVDSLEDASVKAEISGVVSAVNITEGNTASAQTNAVSIVDMSRVKLSFGVTDKVVNHIQPGTRADVTIASVSPEPFSGYVSAVSPAADETSGLYTVEAYLDNPEGTVKPGMFAMVRLATNKHENTISLPVDAVIEKNGISNVFVVGNDLTVHKTQVETGLRNDEYIEVISGLKKGDIVVVVGQDFLDEGNTANITAGPAPAGAETAEQVQPHPDGAPGPNGNEKGSAVPPVMKP